MLLFSVQISASLFEVIMNISALMGNSLSILKPMSKDAARIGSTGEGRGNEGTDR